MGAPKGNSNAKGNRGGTGRPTVYQPRFLHTARYVASRGGLDFQVADALGVDVRTVQSWRMKFPEFAAACEPSDEEQRAAMKRSAYHRGMGYSHASEKIVVVNGEIVRVPTVEHYPPDTAAIKYWLNNRDRANWSERTEVEQSGAVTVRVVGGLPEQEDEK